MIANIQITGIHGDQNIDQDLVPGLNILYAKNGAGKTTFLHVIANLFERDIERFCYLHFAKITLRLTDGTVLSLRQLREGSKPAVVVEINGNKLDEVSDAKRVDRSLDQLLQDKLGGRPVYLPAFRSILEGAKDSSPVTPAIYRLSRESEEYQELVRRERQGGRNGLRPVDGPGGKDAELIATKSLLCREWFGKFVPVIRYPSLSDVDRSLSREIRQAYLSVSRTDQRILSDIFLAVFEAIVNKQDEPSGIDTGALLNQLVNRLVALNKASVTGSENYTKLERRLRDQVVVQIPEEAKIKAILNIYNTALEERGAAESEAFANIQRFLNSVNTFLWEKPLSFRNEFAERHGSDSALYVQLPNNRFVSLRALSSGERHVLTLLFSATHMSNEDGIVLIDEPELSLHVDWQRIILGELMKQVGQRQVIACTHSPEIAAEHLALTRELAFSTRSRVDTEGASPDDDDLASDGA